MPESHQRAAEEVRAHLVVLRGGAPFLSPADSRLLVEWLDAQVPVPAILCAMERAARARHARRARAPLTLRHARRHLKAARQQLVPVTPAFPADTAHHPLSELAGKLREQARDDPRGAELQELAEALLSVPQADPDTMLRQALAMGRGFLDRLWRELSEAERVERLSRAYQELGEALDGLDASSAEQAAEALARDELLRGYPLLSVQGMLGVLEW